MSTKDLLNQVNITMSIWTNILMLYGLNSKKSSREAREIIARMKKKVSLDPKANITITRKDSLKRKSLILMTSSQIHSFPSNGF